MTDANESATKVEGTSVTATGDSDKGQTTAATDPFAGLDEGTRQWVGTKGYKTLADIAKAAQNAESLIGKSVQLPGTDAKPEDWDKVFQRLGRPDKAEGYEFKLPDGLPENFKYDADFAAAFKAEAHKAGLTPKQAATAHDFYVKAAGAAFTAQTEAAAAKATAATEALEKAFGGANDSEAFKRANGLIDRLLADNGGKELVDGFRDLGVLSAEGYVLNAPVAIMLHKLAKQLYTEDGMVRGTTADTGDNPFKEGPLGGNQTAQHKMIKENRPMAERLIRSAGRKPEDWGLKPAA